MLARDVIDIVAESYWSRRLVFMFSDSCEMAYGEQAALIGLLELVQPTLTIEIGTYEGGSLALLADRSAEVDTFDLVSHVESHLPNVRYHLGDSASKVPELLEGFVESGRQVDFALVDGDYSRAGVRADALSLLASPALDRSVIVFHDVANEDVRAGVREAIEQLEQRVAYANLSFVPPWVPNSALSEIWGGLGLIVVDESRTFWDHDRRIDANIEWRTATVQRLSWQSAAGLRALRRRLAYRLRPVVRRIAGVRGKRQTR